MEINTFEDIETDTLNEQNTFNQNKGLFNFSPQLINTIAKTILPLLNNLSKTDKKQESTENTIIETQNYTEIDKENLKMDLPSINPQFDKNNIFNGEKMNKCTKCNHSTTQLQNFSKKFSKQAIENSMEQHKKMVDKIKNKALKSMD